MALIDRLITGTVLTELREARDFETLRYQSLRFDCTMEEGVRLSSRVSRRRISAGAQMVDHCRPESPTLRLRVIQTATPLQIGGAITAAAARALSPIAGAQRDPTLEEAWARLLAFRDNAVILDVDSDRRSYRNYLIEGISEERRLEDGSSVDCFWAIDLVGVAIARARTAPLRALPRKVADVVKTTAPVGETKGRVAKTPAPPAVAEQASAAAGLSPGEAFWNAIGNPFGLVRP